MLFWSVQTITQKPYPKLKGSDYSTVEWWVKSSPANKQWWGFFSANASTTVLLRSIVTKIHQLGETKIHITSSQSLTIAIVQGHPQHWYPPCHSLIHAHEMGPASGGKLDNTWWLPTKANCEFIFTGTLNILCSSCSFQKLSPNYWTFEKDCFRKENKLFWIPNL